MKYEEGVSSRPIQRNVGVETTTAKKDVIMPRLLIGHINNTISKFL